MTLVDTLRAFVRRWYIVLPGIVVAVSVALGAWHVVKPEYVRTATQLLLPGDATLPEGSPNPYLFIGGLTEAADVVVRTAGSNNAISDITSDHPGTRVQITRDPTTSGPVILTTVTAPSDTEAANVLQVLVQRTTTTLDRLQTQEHIAPKYHFTVTTLSIDKKSQLKERKRLLATGGSGGGVLLLTLILASAVEGLRVPREATRGDDSETSDPRGRRPNHSDNADITAAELPEPRERAILKTDSPSDPGSAAAGVLAPTESIGPRHVP